MVNCCKVNKIHQHLVGKRNIRPQDKHAVDLFFMNLSSFRKCHSDYNPVTLLSYPDISTVTVFVHPTFNEVLTIRAISRL